MATTLPGLRLLANLTGQWSLPGLVRQVNLIVNRGSDAPAGDMMKRPGEPILPPGLVNQALTVGLHLYVDQVQAFYLEECAIAERLHTQQEIDNANANTEAAYELLLDAIHKVLVYTGASAGLPGRAAPGRAPTAVKIRYTEPPITINTPVKQKFGSLGIPQELFRVVDMRGTMVLEIEEPVAEAAAIDEV